MDNFIVAVDTRERKRYSFPREEIKTLKTGDYSIVGMEDLITIERKSQSDCYGSLGGGRARFEREFKRLAEMEYAAVVIECSLKEFLTPPLYSRMNPSSAINTLISWSIKYNVHIWFASNRQYGETLVLRILEKFYRQKGKEEK